MVTIKIWSHEEHYREGKYDFKTLDLEIKKLRKENSENLADIVNYLINLYKRRKNEKNLKNLKKERKSFKRIIPYNCEFIFNKKSYLVKFGLIEAEALKRDTEDISDIDAVVFSIRKLKTKSKAKILYVQLLNKEIIKPNQYRMSFFWD